MTPRVCHNLLKPKTGDYDMPKNKVQFQKGLSLHCFQEKYGTEEKCQERLYRARWPKGYICPKCGHHRSYSLKTRQLFQCCKCRYQCSLVSGTIFEASKLPLTSWFLAIFFITQSKEGISSLNLRRFLGVSPNAALRLKHKLQHVMKNADDNLLLEGLIEVDDAYFGGKRKGCKRGRGAAGKTPFLASIARNEKGHPIHMRLSRVKAFTSSEIARWSIKHVHPNSYIITDGYRSFSGLDDAGFSHSSIVTRNIYNNPDNKIFLWVNTMIGNVKNSILGTYHSISQKHLPRYLAEFCFRFNGRYRMELLVPSLIKYAAKTPPLPQHQLKLAEEWW